MLKDKPRKSIALFGTHGSGKSTLGGRLIRELGGLSDRDFGQAPRKGRCHQQELQRLCFLHGLGRGLR